MFWYISSPYSKFPGGLDAAYELACEARGLLIKAGIPCFSPIAHSHGTAKLCGIDPRDHSIWLPVEAPIMAAAHGIIMLKAESWETSYGMYKELKAFQATGKPVVWMNPGELPIFP